VEVVFQKFPLLSHYINNWSEGGKSKALTIARLVMDIHPQRSIVKTPFSLYDASCLESDGFEEANMVLPQVTQAADRAVLCNSNKIKRRNGFKVPFHVWKYEKFWTGIQNLRPFRHPSENVFHPGVLR